MIHVLFSSSAAGSLRQALGNRRVHERVVDLTENLDFGPIGSGEFQARANWFNLHIPSGPEGDWNWIVEHAADFEAKLSTDSSKLIWLDPSSAQELSGLYWYLDRFGGSDIQILVAPQYLAFAGLGVRAPESMSDLLDNCARVSWPDKRFPVDSWSSLQAENCLLRIVRDGELRSASSDYFDDFLMARMSGDWTEWMRVIGNALVDIPDAGHHVSDLFLGWRLRDLVQRGIVAINGELPLYGERVSALVRRK